MSAFERINRGECPNGDGLLTVLKKPIEILYLIPSEVLELAQEYANMRMDVSGIPDNLGKIVAVCSECGFVASVPGDPIEYTDL